MCREKRAGTLLRGADVINGVVDDQLEVLVQQSIDQRGVGDALPICRRGHDAYSAHLNQS